jgi:hypothetical protein
VPFFAYDSSSLHSTDHSDSSADVIAADGWDEDVVVVSLWMSFLMDSVDRTEQPTRHDQEQSSKSRPLIVTTNESVRIRTDDICRFTSIGNRICPNHLIVTDLFIRQFIQSNGMVHNEMTVNSQA